MPGIASFATFVVGGRSASAGTQELTTVREGAVSTAQRTVAAIDPVSIDLIISAAGPSLGANDIRHEIGATRAWAIDLCSTCVATQTGLKIAADLTTADPNLRRVLVVSTGTDAACALLVDRDAAANEILATAWFANGASTPAGRAERVSINHLLTAIECAVTDSGYTVRDISYLAVTQTHPGTREFLLDALDLDEREAECEASDVGPAAGGIVSLARAAAESRLVDGGLVVLAAADPPHSWAATCIWWGARTGSRHAGAVH